MIYSVISNNLPFDKYLTHLLLTGDNNLSTVYKIDDDFLSTPSSLEDDILTLKSVDIRAFSSFYQHKLNLLKNDLAEDIDTLPELQYFTKHLDKDIIHCGFTDFLVAKHYLPISECLMIYVKYDFEEINREFFLGQLTEEHKKDYEKTSDVIDNFRSEYRKAGKVVVTVKYDQLVDPSYNLHHINLNLNNYVDRKLLLSHYLK